MAVTDTGPGSLGDLIFKVADHNIITAKAGGTIAKGDVVTLNAAMGADAIPEVVQGTANAIPYGVALKAASSGEYIPVLKKGYVKLKCSAAISAGAWIKAGATGKAAPAVATLPAGGTAVTSTAATAPVEGNRVLGKAETAAGDDTSTFVAYVDV